MLTSWNCLGYFHLAWRLSFVILEIHYIWYIGFPVLRREWWDGCSLGTHDGIYGYLEFEESQALKKGKIKLSNVSGVEDLKGTIQGGNAKRGAASWGNVVCWGKLCCMYAVVCDYGIWKPFGGMWKTQVEVCSRLRSNVDVDIMYWLKLLLCVLYLF